MREYRAIRNSRNADRTKSYRADQAEADTEKKENGSRWKEQRSHHASYMRQYRAAQKEHLQSVRDEETDRLQTLANAILGKRYISEEDICLMCKGQNFTSDPRLALIYYYCCGAHPEAFVFNDEHLREDESVKERLLYALDSPNGVEEYERCQASAAAVNPTQSCIVARASCCEFLVGADCTHACLPLLRLPDTFRVSEDEFATRYGHLSEDIIRKHAQILLEPDGSKYYLDPDLVKDRDRIQLCSKCAFNPRKSNFSWANGHEYGRYGSLPELSAVAKNCISPVRSFGLELSLSGKHCTGHSICFMSTGPQACAKILPVTDVERRPRVTFIGPSETWKARKKIFRRLYELPSVSIFSWLSVLKETHSFFRKEGIEIDTSEIRAEELTKLEENIENDVVVSDAADLHAVDDAVTSERYGADVNCATRNFAYTVIQQSAVLQPPTTRVPFTIINAMMDAVGIKDDIAVVRRSADPIVEWDENGTMVAGAFPTLFMMGGEMLPSGSFPSDLTRHFDVLLRWTF
ncbi:hypothetical protein DVH05_008638 [Phytophthora capsici]|nr:hypothetical protein DVH05_008638 [Phytophthora capsici]